YSDVDLESIGQKPTALFIVIQDEKKTYHSLVTILLKQCYETLISVAQKNGGQLPVRTNFLLDEFANMPPLKDITTMITAARSRRIRFTMIIQNFAQLDQVYGKENAETIRGNCGNIIYLITTELKALEEISKMCGEVKSKKDDKTASTPLVTVSDLQRMKQFETIILRIRMQPFKTKFTPYFKMKSKFGKSYPKAEYPNREKKSVQTFDMREFVKAKRQEKLKSMMAESGMNGMPGGMPNGFPPLPPMFGGNANNSSRQSRQTNSDINIDDLVKKIDAKIAALEEEEKANAKAQDENKPISNNSTKEKLDTKKLEEKINEKLNANINSSIEDKSKLDRVDINVGNINNNDTTTNKTQEAPTISLDDEVAEDKFFDDFFDD
ncbi:MAG: type IV secretory system conjugative DNA transfer family protein, partial [Erysipelotrichaceae bacterium]